MAKGIIKDNPTATSCNTIVVIGDPNYPNVTRDSVLNIRNFLGIHLDKGDVVEFTVEPGDQYTLTRKLESPKGTITIPSPDHRGGEVRVTDATPNDFGVIAGQAIRFNFLNTGENTPDNRDGDSIQIIIDGAKSSTFVKVLEQAK